MSLKVTTYTCSWNWFKFWRPMTTWEDWTASGRRKSNQTPKYYPYQLNRIYLLNWKFIKSWRVFVLTSPLLPYTSWGTITSVQKLIMASESRLIVTKLIEIDLYSRHCCWRCAGLLTISQATFACEILFYFILFFPVEKWHLVFPSILG